MENSDRKINVDKQIANNDLPDEFKADNGLFLKRYVKETRRWIDEHGKSWILPSVE